MRMTWNHVDMKSRFCPAKQRLRWDNKKITCPRDPAVVVRAGPEDRRFPHSNWSHWCLCYPAFFCILPIVLKNDGNRENKILINKSFQKECKEMVFVFEIRKILDTNIQNALRVICKHPKLERMDRNWLKLIWKFAIKNWFFGWLNEWKKMNHRSALNEWSNGLPIRSFIKDGLRKRLCQSKNKNKRARPYVRLLL